eukprot:13360000-Ditylum_brightwellii.AAC.1
MASQYLPNFHLYTFSVLVHPSYAHGNPGKVPTYLPMITYAHREVIKQQHIIDLQSIRPARAWTCCSEIKQNKPSTPSI